MGDFPYIVIAFLGVLMLMGINIILVIKTKSKDKLNASAQWIERAWQGFYLLVLIWIIVPIVRFIVGVIPL